MTARDLSTYPLTVLRLAGSQAEMGSQQGRALRSLGGYERAMAFYPSMASRVMTQSFPHDVRPAARAVARAALSAAARTMHRHRARLFPEYAARTEALLSAGGQAPSLASALLVMEMLQNTVGFLGKLGAVPGSRLSSAAIPACSSLAVWGASSRDGTLRHARNFDFPGASIWDEAPMVVFCKPDRGLCYGFVSTRGVDVPGITAFNEAGLTLTVHTRFHRDVRLSAASVIDLGHEIIRNARTLAQAVAIAEATPVASTWGILVSSAAEQSAVLIETTGRDVGAVHVAGGRSYMACTNHYLTPRMAAGEVHTSRAFGVDSHARHGRLEQRARESADGLDARDLEHLLGDLGGHGDVRLAGDCLVSPISVQSIVSEPEARRIRVSVGCAPTGFGPYVEVPWSWDGPVGAEIVPHPAEGRAAFSGGRPLSEDELAAVRAYVEVSRLHLEGASPALVQRLCEGLSRRVPDEPHFAALAGYAALSAGDLEGAATELHRALALERAPYRRARLLLQRSRVLSALGRTREAAALRDELLALDAPEVQPEQQAAAREANRPLPRTRLARAVPDFFHIDLAIPGVAV